METGFAGMDFIWVIVIVAVWVLVMRFTGG
jgi:hypothetical protein